jgi:hypothetical protein
MMEQVSNLQAVKLSIRKNYSLSYATLFKSE